jgi:hypothetical protein
LAGTAVTFLNASLIFAVAAVSIPIALHLIARREPRKVVFPSIRLLTQRLQSNRSRLRVRRWWLLALRIAAVAAFALALARPAIDRSLSVTWLTIGLVAALGVALLAMASVALSRGQSRSLVYSLTGAAGVALLIAMLWGGYTYASGPQLSLDRVEPVSIAIVLDNSPTVAWKTVDDDRMGRMQDIATWMVTRLPVTSRIAIIDRSGRPATFSIDVASAISRIEQLRPLQVTQPIAARIDAAARLVRTSDLSNRQILLITDLSESTWGDATSDATLASVLGDAPKVAVAVFDLGDFDQGNRSLSSPKLADATPPKNAPIPISTTLQWSGDESTSSLSVTAELQLYESDPALPVIRDGEIRLPALRSVDRTSVRVSAGASSNLLLTVPPLEVGTHHGQIRLVGDDPLALDDVRYFSLSVLEPAPILLVGQSSDEARVMRLAMSEEFSVEEISFSDLTLVRLEDYPAIIVIDPPRDVLEDPILSEYVQAGGALLACLGPAAGEDPIAPEAFPALTRRWRAAPPGTFFRLIAPSHPLLSPLADITGGVPWSNFRIAQYWQVEPGDESTVLIRYVDTDHAALTHRVFPSPGGRQGRLLTLTTPLPALAESTRGWNELFSGSEPWPAFLLVRQFAEYLTDRGGDGPMARVGGPQLVRLDQPPTNAQDPVETRRLQLFAPGHDSAVPLEVASDRDHVVVGDVSRSGTYWLRGLGRVSGFSANLSDQATRLQRITPDDLDQVFGPDAYTLAGQREDIELAEDESQSRVSLFSPVLFLAMLAFLLEQVLGNRFYRSGTKESSTSKIRASAA